MANRLGVLADFPFSEDEVQALVTWGGAGLLGGQRGGGEERQERLAHGV
ncbi:MAG: hypothetical protein ACKV2U_12695 [Bryobacteraceae bacterium]